MIIIHINKLPVIIKEPLEIKCKFQKTEFFEDQFEEIGQLNYNQAIEFYSTFQFFEELNKYYNRELTSCFPKIVFYSENEKSLTIWAENNEGIFFRYENNFQFFESYVSFDINQNKLELNIIEIIRISSFPQRRGGGLLPDGGMPDLNVCKNLTAWITVCAVVKI